MPWARPVPFKPPGPMDRPKYLFNPQQYPSPNACGLYPVAGYFTTLYSLLLQHKPIPGKKAVKLDPDFALAYLYLSLGEGDYPYFSSSSPDHATKLADGVTEGERELILPADALKRNNQDDISKHRLRLLELYPNDKRVRLFPGNSYFSHHDYVLASKHYKATTLLNDQYHPAFKMPGHALMHQGKTRQAIPHFKDSWDDNPFVWYYTAIAWEKEGKKLKAKKYFKKVIHHYHNSIVLAPLRNKALACLKVL